MKQVMNLYFDKLKDRWSDYNHSLPMVSYDEEVSKEIYVGKPDEYGYICWLPIEKKKEYDFQILEDELECKIHQDIKKYFNSYWFLELAGRYKGYSIVLEHLAPSVGLKYYIHNLIGYRNAHGGVLENTPIGIESNGLLVVVDNKSGQVKLEDFEVNKFIYLAPSMEVLLQDLSFNCEKVK